MDRPIAACVGMAWWKRRRIADFLAGAHGPPLFARSAREAVRIAAARGGAVAVWATREPPELAGAASACGVPLVRVEDGFIRSVGLGSFAPAVSIVLDEAGIYYDPSRESDLERLLRETRFDPALLERARRLVDRLVEGGVTKYNLAGRLPAIAWPAGRRRILVPGQVEDDASVRLGGGPLRGNLDLLARVRAAEPHAFVVYKPHPDIVAGHRKGAVPAARLLRYADRIVRRGSIAALLPEIDELHTLTSLAGFEALLRGVPVTVYGRPFYAGWGLTRDLGAPGRGRVLTLEELAAGVLILYPRYLDPVTRLPCEPERVVQRLARRELWRPGALSRLRRLQGRAIEALRPALPPFMRG